MTQHMQCRENSLLFMTSNQPVSLINIFGQKLANLWKKNEFLHDQVRCTWHENSSKPSAICSNILLMQWQHAWEMASQYYLEANSFAKLSEPSRCFLYFSNLYVYSCSHVKKKKLKTEGSAFPATHALHTQKLKCFWLEKKKILSQDAKYTCICCSLICAYLLANVFLVMAECCNTKFSVLISLGVAWFLFRTESIQI